MPEENISAEEYYKSLENKKKSELIHCIKSQDQVIAKQQIYLSQLKKDIISALRIIKVFGYTHELKSQYESDGEEDIEFVGIPIYEDDKKEINKETSKSYV